MPQYDKYRLDFCDISTAVALLNRYVKNFLKN